MIEVKTTGNDTTGNGTSANPYKTLKKATSVAVYGETIHMAAGTYVETQSSNLPVGVSITGDGISTIIKSSFSTIYQAIIYGNSPEGSNGNQSITNLKFDGQNSTSWCIQIQGRSNVLIHDNTLIDFAQRGIVWGGRADNSDNPPSIYATGNKCYKNTITNCGGFDGTYGYGCLNIGGQDGMLIYENNITTTGSKPGWPIKLWNDGYLKGCKIYDNTLKRPAFPYQVNGTNNYFDFCIEFFNQQGLEIYGNTIEGSIDLNYQTKGSYDYSVYIHDNIIGRDTAAAHCETGIWLEFSTDDCIITDNKFKNCSQPIMFSLRPGNHINNINIHGNTCYGIGKSDGTKQGSAVGIIVNDDSTNYSCNGWNVYNNTFVAITGSNSPFFGVAIPGGNSSVNVNVVNNIIMNFDYYGLYSDYGGHITGLNIKNNDLYNNGSNNGILFNNGNPVNYVNSGNITSNPLLEADYTLKSNSPCINKGIDMGLPYNGSAPDIGAKESGGTVVIPPTANAGENKTIVLPMNTVTLVGTGTGNNITYKWQNSAGGIIANLATVVLSNLLEGSYRYILTVTDANGLTATSDVQITVMPESPVNKLFVTVHVYTDKTVNTSANINKKKTLLSTIKVYTDGTFE